MNPTPREIEASLLEVRKAYRLLHDYQRAALDVAKYIGAQLGLPYAGGYPNFSDCSPRSGSGSLDSWAWDWLNLVFYDFHFLREYEDGKELNLSIWLFSDTGYFLTDNPELDRQDVSGFAPVEVSGTKVGFLLYRKWEDSYTKFLDDPAAMGRFLKDERDLPEDLKSGGVVAKCCDFSRLSEESSTEAVITELIELAKAHGFELERVKKSGYAKGKMR
jgi:hypothetical protein